MGMETKPENGEVENGKQEISVPISSLRLDLNALIKFILVLFVAGLYFWSVNDRINDLSARISQLEQRFDERMNRIEKRLDENTYRLHNLFYDHIDQHTASSSSKDVLKSPFNSPSDAEKLLTLELKATLDTLSFRNKVFSEYELRSKLLQYVRPSDILEAAIEKKVEVYKIHLAMAAYYYNQQKKQP
jgi:hypothetical protein